MLPVQKALSHLFLASHLLLACTLSPPTPTSLQRRNLEEFFIANGIMRYFLPHLPHWANRSLSGNCLRKTSLYLFDMQKLRESFALNYEEAHQLQLMFNGELQKKRREASAKRLSSREEESLFFQSNDKILAGIRVFRPPQYQRVHLIWIDPLLKEKKVSHRLKNLLNSPLMNKGHPVLVSFCLSRDELQNYERRHKLQNDNIRFISYELLGPYSPAKKLLPHDLIDLSFFFKPEQKLHLFLPVGQKLPPELQGPLIIHKY